MMKNIIIIGSGAVAAELTSFIEDTEMGQVQDIQIKGYLDYDENIEKYWKRYNLQKPVLADIDSYEIQDNDYFIIAISDVEFRKKMYNKIKEKQGKFFNFIHPSTIIAKNASLGEANIIYPQCIVGSNTMIGDFNLLTSQTIVSHDSVLGFNNILSTALLCGHVKMGDDNYFGIRATVVPHINIGNRNTIQAGMIVNKKIDDNSTVFYRYKEKMMAIPQL
ncbi:MAG: acetyltransferase [Bacteroidales bacterium]|nr:acetyltransferase [Bacteroidales bacterium]